MPTRMVFKVERAKDVRGTATSPVPLLGAALNADVYPVVSLHHNGTEIARVQGATCRSGGTDPVWRGTKDITIILGESLDSRLHELQVHAPHDMEMHTCDHKDSSRLPN